MLKDFSMKEELLEQLKDAGVTCTSDGLLSNFIQTENYGAAYQACCDAIKKRLKEIKHLQDLKDRLCQNIP